MRSKNSFLKNIKYRRHELQFPCFKVHFIYWKKQLVNISVLEEEGEENINFLTQESCFLPSRFFVKHPKCCYTDAEFDQAFDITYTMVLWVAGRWTGLPAVKEQGGVSIDSKISLDIAKKSTLKIYWYSHDCYLLSNYSSTVSTIEELKYPHRRYSKNANE